MTVEIEARRAPSGAQTGQTSAPAPPSRVSVRIEPTAAGSRVLLVHGGFVSKTATYRRFRRAHPLALDALRSVVETGELPIRARLYTLVFKPGMKLFTVRAEPWEGALAPAERQ